MSVLTNHDVVVRESTLSRIRAQGQDAGPAARKVVDYILAKPAEVIKLTVTELAEAAGVSAATVTRSCRILGYSGYQELRLNLARESDILHREVHAAVETSDNPDDVLAKVTASSSRAVAEVYGALDRAAFTRSTELLSKADRLLLVAIGASAPLAADAAHRFATIGLPTVAPVDTVGQGLQARLLTRSSVCLAISHSGASEATVEAANLARRRGASVIAITSFPRSPLTQVSDCVLQVGGDEAYRLEALASRMAHIVVLDSLYVATAVADPERTQSALEESGEVVSRHRL